MSLQDKINSLPTKSGVYIMKDIGGNIIYIGKAVVLKNRVKQYFTNTQKIPKVQQMVENIADFEYIITLSEKDALSLEANLIKKHKPKYNILLKDDKSRPYIRIDLKEKFPTLEVTRNVKKDGARYFGPYFYGVLVKDIIAIIKSAYRMRDCQKKFVKGQRECLNYHINLCASPCCNHVDSAEYGTIVQRVMAFLSGHEDTAERLIAQKMADASENEEFERAIEYRNQLEMLKKLKERTLTDLGANSDFDSFIYVTDSYRGAISVSIVRNGKMMGVKNFILSDASASDEEALTGFIVQYYSKNGDIPSQICLESEFDSQALKEYINSLSKQKIEIIFPKIGLKKKLVDMAKQNALDYLEKSVEKSVREQNLTINAADELQKILNIKSTHRIECYDISNISGTDKVASGVAFINGAPAYSDYRRYKIKTVEGSNDFACMAEVMRRRLERAKDGDQKFVDLPDLIVIDGGKGQLSAAYQAMTEAGYNIDMISLAEREEEIFMINSQDPIILPKSNYALRLLIRIRDEAHRFAITYHRNLRAKKQGSRLEEIKGVGKVKRKILYSHFDNISSVAAADIETLAAIKGIDRRTAIAVYDFFHKGEQNEV